MISWIKNYQFNSMLTLFTYWIPLAFCLTVYLFRFVAAYRRDLKNCAENYYRPSLTVGSILGHFMLAIIPAVNLFTLVFSCAPEAFRAITDCFDIPLVRARPKTTRDN